MKHEIHSVTNFNLLAPYIIEIEFENNEKRKIDFSLILIGELYGPLKDINLFNAVKLDNEVKTLVWPNGADFDPSTLYNWNNNIEEIKERVSSW